PRTQRGTDHSAWGPLAGLTELHVIRALEADRRGTHAFGADRPVAPHAAHTCLAHRMPVAARQRLRRRGAGVVAALSVRHGCTARVGHQLPDGSTVTEVIVMSSTGRSLRPVRVLAILSTTARLSASATSPKIVCLRFRCGVGPTVMKNCEPFVFG